MALLILSLMLFFTTAYSPAALQTTRGKITDLFAPLLAAVNYPIETSANYIKSITGLAHLQAENQRLMAENARLKEWHQTAIQLQSENEALHKLANLKTSSSHHFISAKVIADFGNTYVKSILVMAGKKEGVEKGQAVLSSEGLVGRVIETGDKTSRILLLNDMNSRIPVVIGKNKWRAVIAGQNNDEPTLVHLPSGVKLKENMIITTSGHGGLFPSGLPIGKIKLTPDGGHFVDPYAIPNQFSYVKIINTAIDKNLRKGQLQ
jgi:rod shape-determining protein MreC